MAIKDPILVTNERQCLATLGCSTMRCNTYSESPTSIYGFFFFKHPAEYTETETKRKKRVTLLMIIPNHMLIKMLLLISGGLEVLVPKGERLLPRDTHGSTWTERWGFHRAILCFLKTLNGGGTWLYWLGWWSCTTKGVWALLSFLVTQMINLPDNFPVLSLSLTSQETLQSQGSWSPN